MIDRLQLSGRQQELQQHTQPYRHGYTKRATADNLLTIFEFRRIFPQNSDFFCRIPTLYFDFSQNNIFFWKIWLFLFNSEFIVELQLLMEFRHFYQNSDFFLRIQTFCKNRTFKKKIKILQIPNSFCRITFSFYLFIYFAEFHPFEEIQLFSWKFLLFSITTF